MASKQPSKTTQVTKVELPEWVDEAAQKNYQLAEQLGSAKFKQYKGDRVADIDPLTLQAQQYLQDNLNKSTEAYGRASNLFDQIANFNVDPGTVTAGQLADTDLSKYLNPYTSEVIDKTLADADRSRIQALMGNSDAARAAGAFGGSRHGIVDAVTNAEALKDMGLLSSQLRQAGYSNAQQAALADISNKYAADVSNRDASVQAQLAKLQGMTTGAQGLLSSADAENAVRQQNYTNLFSSGLFNQQHRQSQINADMEKFNEKRNYDLENLNLRLAALGMSPYGKTETANKTVEGGSSGTDWVTGGLGLFSLLLGLSDDSTKTDVEKVGKLPNSNLNVYAFRYKKDPKTYPKGVGLMASEVEKEMPEAVTKIGKKRVVNYGEVMRQVANGV